MIIRYWATFSKLDYIDEQQRVLWTWKQRNQQIFILHIVVIIDALVGAGGVADKRRMASHRAT